MGKDQLASIIVRYLEENSISRPLTMKFLVFVSKSRMFTADIFCYCLQIADGICDKHKRIPVHAAAYPRMEHLYLLTNKACQIK
jgi:hypothetical protein